MVMRYVAWGFGKWNCVGTGVVDFEVGLCGELGWGAFGIGDGVGCYYCEDGGWRRVGAGGGGWRVHVGVD